MEMEMETLELEIPPPPEKKLKFEEEEKDVDLSSGESTISTESSKSNLFADLEVKEGPIPAKDDYYDYESDEEIRNIRQEDVDKYYEQVEESEGFDVDYFKGMAKLHYVTPKRRPWSAKFSNCVTEFAWLSINHYNKKEGAQLQLTDIVKINGQYGSYPTVYLTFEARGGGGGGGEAKTYQAKLFGIPGEKEQRVAFVRLKPE